MITKNGGRFKIDAFIKDCIRSVYQHPSDYRPATHTENTLRMYCRFACMVSGFETLFEEALRAVAKSSGYASGRLTEGYYRENPTASDAAVQRFVLTQFDVLIASLSLRLPKRAVVWRDSPRPIMSRQEVARNPPPNRLKVEDIRSIPVRIRAALADIYRDPFVYRSAYDLEDELLAFFWFWGISIGERDEIDDTLSKILYAHGAGWGTLTRQFFLERPWATVSESIGFVARGYESVYRTILAD